MSLHVVQLGPVPPPEGGISRNITAIWDELCSRGHRCSVVATSKSAAVIPQADVYRPRSAIQLIGHVRELRPDVLHLHVGGDVSRRVMSLAFAASMLASKTVLTLHSGAFPLSDHGKHASRATLRGFVLRRFSHVIAVNQSIAEVFQRYGIVDDRISVILPQALKSPDRTIELREDLSRFAEAHSPFILSVGGLENEYDPIFQISSMSRILGEMPNAGLMIVGNGSMQREVSVALSQTRYSDRVMLAGNIDHGQTLRLIEDADVMLRTTLFDGDAISVREGLYVGTPVIATDNGMRPDGVRLIRSGDSDGLVRRIAEAYLAGKAPRDRPLTADNTNICALVDLYESLM